ncbi:DUF2971 domain-containing protein [Prevotella stercorea]|uniref:DUF2971 domain-containing protein n=1 Tax=Leyella stercorea TaxID=363265 RepID=UPI001F19AEE6|nr:DUF2971 domain-containing protein [Leyella stercorea]MCF2577993.1 DUF2971 domain-containing protein [Leyella stercorea]
MKIYHYTSIETLALILKSKSIRFNRLDNVDDLEESMYGSGPKNQNLSKYIFVSCWTKSEEENLALWKMYAGYNGIRIGLDENLFVSYPNTPFDTIESFYKDIFHFGPDYCAAQQNNLTKLEEVKYIDSPRFAVNDLVSISGNTLSIKTSNWGLVKSKEWAIQQESRFRIQTLPLNYAYVKSYSAEILNTMDRMVLTKAIIEVIPAIVRSIEEDYKPQTSELFMPIKDDALNNMEIMMGPQTSDAQRLIVEALVQDLSNITLTDSKFKGKVRGKFSCI